jgi:NADH dehydrogenase [ubiquinone] 1 alpha subcomplex assembly factor 2
MMKRLAQSLRLGKWKNLKGYDLEGNAFFEDPTAQTALPKRFVEYKIQRHLSEYRFESIAPQWSAWLRHTRPNAPTLDVCPEVLCSGLPLIAS